MSLPGATSFRSCRYDEGSTLLTVSATCVVDQAPFAPVITDTYDYDAFGNKINSTGSTPTTCCIGVRSLILISACTT